MKIKIFVACEIQYFEIGIFSFNSYVYYLTRGFIASTRAFNLLTRAFNLPTRTFNLATRASDLLTRAFNLLTRAFNLANRAFGLLTRGYELVTRGFELITRGFELVTRVLLSTFVLFSDVAVTFPCHSNLFLPKIYNFSLFLSNKVLQPLHWST